MFNNEFFPTPRKIIGKMLQPFLKPDSTASKFRGYDSIKLINDMVILEPSAGKGDILDYITGNTVIHEYDAGEKYYGKKNGNILQEKTKKLVDNEQIYCIEKDPNLKYILSGKGYKVIADDFLNYNGDYLFDLIIMNPPFSNGDKHILKAWELLDEGHIVCLLNSETIRNPYTESRLHLLTLINQFGSIEQLGNCFSDAEIKTDVEVVLIRLHKTTNRKKLDFEFESVKSEKKVEFNEDTFKDPIAVRDVVGNMIIKFDMLKQWYIKWLEAREAMLFYQEGLTDTYTSAIKIAEESLCNKKNSSYNKFNDAMKQQIWKEVFDKIDIQKYMTHNVRENFNKFSKDQGCMDFNKENVANLISLIFENRYEILEQAVVDLFDRITSHNAENRYMIEGWKTNDKWKVNRKIILPYVVEYGKYMNTHDIKRFGDTLKISYSRKSEYSDIDKVMCYLTGTNYDTLQGGIFHALDNKFHIIGNIKTGDKFDNTCESYFFDLKFWKKGTLHLTFKDEALWNEFNMRACAGKKWLPEKEKQEWEKSRTPQDPISEKLLLSTPLT